MRERGRIVGREIGAEGLKFVGRETFGVTRRVCLRVVDLDYTVGIVF